MVDILEASACLSILVRNLKKDIGYERATSAKPRSQIHEVIEHIEALDLQSFEA